ncbi:hypothetical protein [Paenibacillus hexagrammi]|uniref:Uncharacterized protein n=1 Tax=Paenibacillus hexagrammi TaxID=2908839 RepID=A0ABY3SPM3_9BACL|nr:hypothetical protein [Paenibacillus sp. YPD9-1]UJF35199.1 hypothetical protein L0M14_08775 [Paenibacillus sp. YPD9-1]
MRTVYENYRGFKISKEDNTYSAIHNEVIFNQGLLSDVLDHVDHYIEIHIDSTDNGDISQH